MLELCTFLQRNNVFHTLLIASANQRKVTPSLTQRYVVWSRMHIKPVNVKAIVLPETHWADVVMPTGIEREVITTGTLVHDLFNVKMTAPPT